MRYLLNITRIRKKKERKKRTKESDESDINIYVIIAEVTYRINKRGDGVDRGGVDVVAEDYVSCLYVF